MKRLRWGLLALVMLVLAGTSAQAGVLGVYSCPTNESDVTHYRVYEGITLIVDVPIAGLVPSPGGLVGDTTGPCPGVLLVGTELTSAPNNCESRTYTARFAIEITPGVFEESGDSPSVTSIARPHVESASVATTGIRQVVGENFIVGTTVTKIDGTVIPTTFMGCQLLEIEDTVVRTIIVTTPNGLAPFQFTIPIEVPSGTRAH